MLLATKLLLKKNLTMKKIFIITTICIASLSACKNDYECTGTDDGEKKVLGECLDCSKSDIEDREKAYKALGVSDASCEKK